MNGVACSESLLLVGLSLLLPLSSSSCQKLNLTREITRNRDWNVRQSKSCVSGKELHRGNQWNHMVQTANNNNGFVDRVEESHRDDEYLLDQDESSQIGVNVELSALIWTDKNRKNHYTFNKTTLYIPNAIDYRTMGYVSSVDYQGICHAPWAFVVAGAVEALIAKKTGTMRKLSTQQILDCTGPGNDCTQGKVFNAMHYVKQFGLMLDCDYSYEAQKEVCRYNPNNEKVEIKNFIGFPNLNEMQLRHNIATLGPGISHVYMTRALRDYRGGLFSMRSINTFGLRLISVLIVGYDSSDGKDYWIIKNNFGTDWGENGYLKLECLFCGIGNYNFWPGV